MLETMRRGQRWLTTIFITVIGLVFVFFLGLGEPLTGSGNPDGTVVRAGSIRFNLADYYRTRAAQAEQFRERLGDQFDADAAKGFLDSQTLRRLVEDTVKELPEHHRLVFRLRELEGKSYEEISEITGVNLGTVKSRLHRARNSFAQRIEPFLN